MIGNLVTLLIFVVLMVLFAWFTKRAWGSKHKVLKWPLLILAGLLTLVSVLIIVIGGKGLIAIYQSYPVAPVNITVENTPEQIARGQHIADMFCAGCHSQNGQLPLSGGKNLADDTGIPLGDLYPPNITPGGKTKDLTDSDIFRILNTGVEPSGRITFMNGVNTRFLSDDDKKAIIAYLRSQPAVQEQRPPFNYSFVAAFFNGAGLINFEQTTTIQSVNAPPKAETKEYGEYIASYGDCHSCHGPTLTGDSKPPLPKGANLTQIVPKWSKDDFIKAMRTGVDRDGHTISDVMPWRDVGKMDDEELGALWMYLHSLTPVLAPAQ